MVLATHASATHGCPGPILMLGELGVRVFFVISGFLITTLLLGEIDRHGHISLGRFYLRRTFRIFPAYYAYLFAILVAVSAGWIASPAEALHPRDALHAFTYTTNYHPHRSWWMGHTWSLSVEEQFYLLWPAVLVLFGARSGMHAALAFVVLGPAIRLADWYGMPGWRDMQGESFWTAGDAIAIGCVLAMVRPRLERSRRWLAFQRSWLFWIVPLLLLAAYGASVRYALAGIAIGQSVTIVCIAACVDRAIRFPDGAVGRFLNCRPMIFIGTLSYSLYLWQQPFLNRHSTSFVAAFPQNLAFAVIAALASYHVIEKPFLALRERIEARVLPKRRKPARAAMTNTTPATAPDPDLRPPAREGVNLLR